LSVFFVIDLNGKFIIAASLLGRFYIENNKINFNLSSVEYLLKFGNLTAYFTNFSNFYKRYFIVSKRGA